MRTATGSWTRTHAACAPIHSYTCTNTHTHNSHTYTYIATHTRMTRTGSRPGSIDRQWQWHAKKQQPLGHFSFVCPGPISHWPLCRAHSSADTGEQLHVDVQTHTPFTHPCTITHTHKTHTHTQNTHTTHTKHTHTCQNLVCTYMHEQESAEPPFAKL